jgi:hypothetical protein
MKTYEVTVRDAGGFVFSFDYKANDPAGAVQEFKKGAKRAGIRSFRKIKVLEVNEAKR